MQPQRWQQIKQVMLAALDHEPEGRSAFLEDACGDDVSLRQHVESLIASDRSAVHFLEDPVFRVPNGDPGLPVIETGGRIGPYEVLREIARGGMGTVYLAVRAGDEYRNRVAIKVLKPGMADEDVVRRFRTEGHILAELEHPNIARLLDGGTTPEGAPFLVIEYLEGEPIDSYCESRELPVGERLRLLRRVCAAVEFAHHNLVVHRDLKPGNILITAEGEPKLLDFGIAKLLNPQGLSQTGAATAAELRLMTPEYAAPEQVLGAPITTATDVYALGLVLYKLLTGRLPYHLKSRRLAEILRAICEQEPERPSSAVNLSHPSSRNLRRRLEGDLDHIVLMALRKEPEKRYRSVEELSEDLRRHLEGLPVVARKGSGAYRAGRFIRRHAVPLAAAVTLVATSLLFAVTMAVQRQQIARERDRAEQVSEFFVDMFEAADPHHARGETITAREILDRGSEEIRQELHHQPELRSALMDTMGRVYRHLGLYDDATALVEEALALRRKFFGERSIEVAASLNHLGELRQDQSEYRKAEALHRQALEIHRDLLGKQAAGYAGSLSDLGAALCQQADYPAAEECFREALEVYRRVNGERHPSVAQTLLNLSESRAAMGDLKAAESATRRALEIAREAYGKEHPLVASAQKKLAKLLETQGKLAEAETLYRKVLSLRRRLFKGDHYDVAESLNDLALVLKMRGDYEAAEPLYRESLAMARKVLGDEHEAVAIAISNLASLLQTKGAYSAAEPLYRQALAMARKVHGEEHPRVANTLNNLAALLDAQGEYEAAERLHREALALRRKIFGEEHPHVANSLINLATTLRQKGEIAESEVLYRQGLMMLRKFLGQEHEHVAVVLDELARLLYWKRDHAAAETAAREALAMRRKLLGADHPTVGRSLTTLAAALESQGRYAEAETMAREALQILAPVYPKDHVEISEARSILGASLMGLKRYAEAEPLLLESYTILRGTLGEGLPSVRKARDRLIALYEAWGKPDRVAEYRALSGT